MSRKLVFVSTSAICILTATAIWAQRNTGGSRTDWNAIQKSYAEANLELAQARLALAMNQNETVPDAVSKDTLNSLQAGVELAKSQLAELSKGDTANPFVPQIAAAEITLNGLESDYQAGLESNKLAPGSVTDLEMRREAAEVAVAKARLAALQSLRSQPPEVRMQWEIDRLQDEIRALWARPLIQD
jgi:hypothetical protein